MSQYKGTKGRWRVIEGWNSKGEGKYFPSVVLFGPNDDGMLGRNRIVINVSHDQKKESLMANALLISKAPELLEFVEGLYEDKETFSNLFPSQQKRLRELIKEATTLTTVEIVQVFWNVEKQDWEKTKEEVEEMGRIVKQQYVSTASRMDYWVEKSIV